MAKLQQAALCAAGHELVVELVMMTPDRAERMLAQNSNFRALSDARAQRYARMMADGEWELNGETVKENCDGSLKDGQHRLRAVVISGATVPMLLVRGVKSDINIDTGAARKFQDLLHANGETCCAVLSATVRWQWKYEHGCLRATGLKDQCSPNGLLDVLKRHPGLRDSAARAERVKAFLPQSAAGFLNYQFAVRDPDMAAQFFSSLKTGDSLKMDDAVFRLREAVLREKRTKGRRTPVEWMALTIKAWNFWRRGAACSQLVWRAAGPAAEEFPEIA